MARYAERIRYSLLGPGTKAASRRKYTSELQIVTLIAARKLVRQSTTMIAKTKNSQEGLVGPSVITVITAANAMSSVVQIPGSSEAAMPRSISANIAKLYARCRVRTINEDSSMKNHPPLAGSMYHDASASTES